MQKDIQDLLDELEEACYYHEDCYEVNRIRAEIDEWLERHTN